MLKKTQGIVINYIKYKESSLIVKVYTLDFGLQSCIINGVRSAKAKNKMALFQPLTLLDLVIYYKKNTDNIRRITEVKCNFPYQSVPFDFKKTSIALFLAEVLTKSLKEENENAKLYDFLQNSLQYFDTLEKDFNNFHLHFLIKLSRYLGFHPLEGKEIFIQISEVKNLLLDYELQKELEQVFDFFIQKNYQENINLNSQIRSEVIDYILEFYKIHIPNFDNLKSLEVLRDINQT